MAHDVFISYSTKDKKVVEGLSAYLEQNGIRCWIAYRDIPPGKNWADFIPQAIIDCKIMVYVHSETSNVSTEIDKEIALCLKHHHTIIPFWIEKIDYQGSKSYHLETINWIDAFPNPNKCFGELLEAVRSFLKKEGNLTRESSHLKNNDSFVKTNVTPDIRWMNTDSIKIKNNWRYLFLAFSILFLLFFGIVIISGIGDQFYREHYISSFFYLLISIMLYRQYYNKNKKPELSDIASAIENTNSNIRFITKAGKYGLYDWKKEKVLLPAIYDFIKNQNDFFYTVKQRNKYGIYNSFTNSFIVSCEYDIITPFVNNVARITKDNVTKKVDTQGNIF